MAELRRNEFDRQALIMERLSPHIKDLMDHYARAATNNVAGADSVAVCVDIREHSKSAADAIRRQRGTTGEENARLDLFHCNESGDREEDMRDIAARALKDYRRNKRSKPNSVEREHKSITSAAATTFTIKDTGHYYYTVTFVAKGELVKARNQEDANRIGSAIMGKVNDILSSEVSKATDAEGNTKDTSFDELIACDGECMFTQW